MSFILRIMVNGKWEVPLSPMPRAEARVMAKWYRTYATNVERTKVVPTFKR